MDSASLTRMAIDIYTTCIIPYAVPIAFGFGMCNLIVTTFLRVAFGGKLKFGSGGLHG